MTPLDRALTYFTPAQLTEGMMRVPSAKICERCGDKLTPGHKRLAPLLKIAPVRVLLAVVCEPCSHQLPELPPVGRADTEGA